MYKSYSFNLIFLLNIKVVPKKKKLPDRTCKSFFLHQRNYYQLKKLINFSKALSNLENLKKKKIVCVFLCLRSMRILVSR